MKRKKQTVVISREHAEAMIAMSFLGLYLMAERQAIIASRSNHLAMKMESQPVKIIQRKIPDPKQLAWLSDLFPDKTNADEKG